MVTIYEQVVIHRKQFMNLYNRDVIFNYYSFGLVQDSDIELHGMF